MSSSPKVFSAAEFVLVAASNILLQEGLVKAVLVIVAYEPSEGSVSAPVVMNAWGGTGAGQVEVLRMLADQVERSEAQGAPAPTMQ
jgi:hypothetical protein